MVCLLMLVLSFRSITSPNALLSLNDSDMIDDATLVLVSQNIANNGVMLTLGVNAGSGWVDSLWLNGHPS